ncbi:MAG: ATP-binding protein [Chloroflexi bacterium]|nr:ATP-binding protein [Chloroflexota bacterium]MCY3938343.1 ATP-binding protein [Chloroflexota bacterium]
MTPSPCLLIVNGHPATGKTTLAEFLSRRLALPLLSKDYVKETLGDQLGTASYEDSTRLGRAAFEIIFTLAESWLGSGGSVILESPLRADIEDSRIARLESECPCTATQIVLTADPATLSQRYRLRSREPSRHHTHFDHERFSQIDAMVAEPLKPLTVFAGTLTVDTSDWTKVDYDSILDWVLESTNLSDRRT